MKKAWILALFAAMALAAAGCQNERVNVSVSRATAEQWVKDVLPGYRVVGFSSATLDTDDDGYVTCEITVTKNGTDLKLIQLAAPTHGHMLQIQKGNSAKLVQVPMNNTF